VAYPAIFSVGGGSTNSVEDIRQRERGSRGGSPLVRGSARCYGCTDVRNWKFGSDLSKLGNFGGGV
jgi:hypothetical protein